MGLRCHKTQIIYKYFSRYILSENLQNEKLGYIASTDVSLWQPGMIEK